MMMVHTTGCPDEMCSLYAGPLACAPKWPQCLKYT